MKVPNNIIEKWMYNIFHKDKSSNIVHEFGDICNKDLSSSLSPETIFLTLVKKGLIRTHEDNLKKYKWELESGLRPSANHFLFIITDKGSELLLTIKGEKLLVSINNQLKLDL